MSGEKPRPLSKRAQRDLEKREAAAAASKRSTRREFIGLSIAALGGGLMARSCNKNQEIAAEKELYGDLYELKEKLAERMILKSNANPEIDKYEEFLPKLEQHGGRFVVKCYMGEPPSLVTGLKLGAINEDEKQVVRNGLNYWKKYIDFQEVNDINDADLKIFREDHILSSPQFQIAARAVSVNSWNGQGWRRFLADAPAIGTALLLSSEGLKKNSTQATETIAHEFAHHLGLGHLMDAVYFEKHPNGPNLYAMTLQEGAEAIGIIEDKYPQIRKLSIMTSADDTDARTKIGLFDEHVFKKILQKFHEKYPAQGVGPAQQRLQQQGAAGSHIER